MPNENCLAGMQCPECGSYQPFYIEISTTVMVFDSGTEEISGEVNWNEGSTCECRRCNHIATVGDFKKG